MLSAQDATILINSTITITITITQTTLSKLLKMKNSKKVEKKSGKDWIEVTNFLSFAPAMKETKILQ